MDGYTVASEWLASGFEVYVVGTYTAPHLIPIENDSHLHSLLTRWSLVIVSVHMISILTISSA